jgi:hypothetical protein
MRTSASIAELQNTGVKFEADEAVAIAQQLIEALRHCDNFGIEPPYGPPTPANVVLKADGSVACVGCHTTPAVSEVAIFLDTLLPAGSPRVPGGLRYAIARGLLDVDVPPFDSLEEFSDALARFEHGARDAAVRGVLSRAGGCMALARRTPAERRRAQANVSELRRALREADVRLYQQHLATVALPVPTSPSRARMQTMPAVAACLGAGFLLIAAGQFMHERELTARAVVPVAAPAAVSVPAPLAPQPIRLNETREVLSVQTAPAAAARRVPAPRRTAETVRVTQRAAEPRAHSVRTPSKPIVRTGGASVRDRARRRSPGVLDRLRLRWLRDAFSFRSDS